MSYQSICRGKLIKTSSIMPFRAETIRNYIIQRNYYFVLSRKILINLISRFKKNKFDF